MVCVRRQRLLPLARGLSDTDAERLGRLLAADQRVQELEDRGEERAARRDRPIDGHAAARQAALKTGTRSTTTTMTCSVHSCVTCRSRPIEWEALDESDLMAFSRGAQARFLEAGATLYLQGDECEGIYCVPAGLVGVCRVDSGGRSALLRGALKPDRAAKLAATSAC